MISDRAAYSVWVLTATLMSGLIGTACESRPLEEFYITENLAKISKDAAKGYLSFVGPAFEKCEYNIRQAVSGSQKLFGKTPDAYRAEFHSQVIQILTSNWAPITQRMRKAAKNPEEDSTSKYWRKNKKLLDAMFVSLKNDELNERWKALWAERLALEADLRTGQVTQQIEQARGKVLVWSEGLADSDLTKCVLDRLKPMVTDRDWLKVKKPPADETRKAAWGTVAIRAEVVFAEYVDTSNSHGKQVQSRVPKKLRLDVSARLPSRPNLPPSWTVSVERGSPGQITGSRSSSARLQASQLALDGFRDLWKRGCAGFDEQVNAAR
jgi:hypothetical protein